MIPLAEFRAENTEIKELCSLLNITVDHIDFKDNAIVCELMTRFTTCVSDHLMHEDRSVYKDLLQKHTPEADKIAERFVANTIELKRVFNEYKRDWCAKTHSDKKHNEYAKESKEIFKLVCDRITFEEEKIFPHFE